MQDSRSVPAPGSDSPTSQRTTPEAAKQKRNRAFYSYLLIWLTGLIFLFVERDDPDVKYHAAQSLVYFGGAAILSAILESLASTSPSLGFASWISGFIGLFSFIVWIYAMYRAALAAVIQTRRVSVWPDGPRAPSRDGLEAHVSG